MYRLAILLMLSAGARGGLFDNDLHDSVLDEELCELQMGLLLNSTLGLLFLDSSGMFPTGVYSGNTFDLGDYDQCLYLRVSKNGQTIGGKYCLVDVPLPVSGNNTVMHSVGFQNVWKLDINLSTNITLGLCIPRVCTLKESLALFPKELSDLKASVRYYRILDDKPWLPQDYWALAIFSFIGLLNLVSTSYDLHQKFAEKKHAAKPSALLRSFSVLSNTRQLLAARRAGALASVDGLRALSMLWVVLAHTFIFSYLSPTHNADYVDYFLERKSVLIGSASFAVDTFTALSGIFCVYGTLSKFTLKTFTKNLHLFYLNRLLRMFPLLACVVLLHASLVNHVGDGPLWGNMDAVILPCRTHWWSALLHIQNYINGDAYCIPQSWYLSADTQLHALSPAPLALLLAGRRAGRALAAALTLALAAATVYNFYDILFSNGVSSCKEWRIDLTILERNPIFCVGMAYGYLLHQLKGKRVRINQFVVMLLWGLAAAAMIAIPLTTAKEAHIRAFEKQWYDHFVNAYMRSVWGLAIGWVIFACAHGYGGPVNWFLSLRAWTLLSRLSYAMYLTHNVVSVVHNASWYKSRHLTVQGELHQYLADVTLTALVSFALCVLVDAPVVALRRILVEEIWVKSKTETSTVVENERKENTSV